MEPGNLILKHSATYYKLLSEKPNPKLLVGIKYFGVVKNVKKYFLNSNKFGTLVKNQTNNSFFLPTSTRLSSKIWKSCQVQGLIVGGGRAKWPIYHSYWLDFSMKLPLCLFCLFLLTLLFSDSFPSLF